MYVIYLFTDVPLFHGGVMVSYREDKEPVSVEFLNASLRKLIEPDEVSVTLQTKRAAAG
ncbi:MAG: hypothetical protein Q8M92_02700 [Candidatus Subteraquimicrobiales bacterium]|nr:hypothetical protein [Candidatus Subteraquimicrobiales bacterium]